MARGKGKPFIKGDPRCNRKGAPPREETFAGCFRELLSLDGPAVVAWAAAQAKEFEKLPAGVPLRSLVCLWAVGSLSRDFSASVFNAIADRVDGRVDDYAPRIKALEALLDAKEKENQI